MKIAHHISALGTLLSCAHLILALFVYSQDYEGSWGYLPMVSVDFPISVLLAIISNYFELNSAWPLFFIFGSAWWYFIGLWLPRVFRKGRNQK